jgi:AmiR/NasT family two-component response regulator
MDDGREGCARMAESLADAEQEIEQLHHAVENRTIIGQAEGILMERLGIDACQALEYLKRVSSHTNRKVIDIASEIAETRKLPQS